MTKTTVCFLTQKMDGSHSGGICLLQIMLRGCLHLANFSCPSFHLNAERVNSAQPPFLFFLNRGYLARFAQKLVNAVCRWRRACWSATALTSFKKANSSCFFQLVSISDVCAYPIRSCLEYQPSVLAASALLKTRRTHPRRSGARVALALHRDRTYTCRRGGQLPHRLVQRLVLIVPAMPESPYFSVWFGDVYPSSLGALSIPTPLC